MQERPATDRALQCARLRWRCSQTSLLRRRLSPRVRVLWRAGPDSSSCEIVNLRIHVVGGFHHFRIGFVTALRDDQVDELVDYTDIRLFGIALQQRTDT